MWPTPPEAALKSVNASLAALSQSPIEHPRLLRSEKYQTEKLEKLQIAASKKLKRASGSIERSDKLASDSNTSQEAKYFREMIMQLKDVFSSTNDRMKNV